MNKNDTKCAIVAVVGAPNAGKSTLVNKLTGHKVSIVTHKAQTTRNRIMGIFVEDNAQIILADTPGIFNSAKKDRLEHAMVQSAIGQAGDADSILFVVDASKRGARAAQDTLSRLPKDKPRFLALNKIDVMKRADLLPIASKLQEVGQFDGVFMISALKGAGCDDLKKALVKHAPIGHFLYDADALTDMPQRVWAAEMTREQAMLQLHDEIPYGLHVETTSWDERPDQVVVEQIIIVEHDRHKAMVIGKGGTKIKEIGTRARSALMIELGKTVHLELLVKVGNAEREALKLIQ